ncbi:hypothetical protein Ferp_0671 [Ferroglobus placidus DSM 10642]|uniref:Glycosyl hydrolase family 32 domain protein n=1 Tax=Ferroglobus placidus (strain DSM 10642 / AEDII12DO) TaxID=589924 RepID=D3S3K9_FERPA|nr:hypothetical protein [Ferroglobus placidus]ADC64842.1 hypothetical protein Ferp_0671 [Ferroglobus placidus DSM 10642]
MLKTAAVLVTLIYLFNGGYPVLEKFNDTYWMVFKGDDGIYITSSKDLKSWSAPVKIPGTKQGDYHPWFIIDRNGVFRVVYVKHEIINPESIKYGFDYDIYATYSYDGVNWVEPYPVAESEKIDWYPHLYQDKSGKFWLTYSVAEENGSTGIYVRESRDFITWSEAKVVIPPDGEYIFGKLFEFKGKWWMNYAKFTGDKDNLTLLNNHDIFIAYGDSPYELKNHARITSTPPLNFTLYNDAKADDERIWIAYTSTVEGNEEVYLISSRDGVNWTKPVKLSRNVEYISQLEEPFNFKCDQKSVLIEKDRVIVAYQSAIFRENRSIWLAIVNKSEIPAETFSVKYWNDEKTSKESPLGVEVLILSITSAAMLRKILK